MRTVLFLILASFFISCEKEAIPTMEGKWEIDKSTYEEYYGGNLVFTQDYELTGETIEFRGDGQMELIDNTGKRVSTYTLEGDKITYLSITYQIQDLTENSVTLLDHHVHGAGEYHDTYLYLKR